MSAPAKHGRRYTSADASRARDLHEAGWTVAQITGIFHRDGTTVHSTTVRRWVDHDYAERQRNFHRQLQARQRATESAGRLRGMFERPELKLARIQGLHRAGVPPRVIPTVMRFDFPDLELTYGQVRYAIETGRLPSEQEKAA